MKSKIEKLVELVNKDVKVRNLQRLVDGDLAYIGDAWLAGKELVIEETNLNAALAHFNGPTECYTIKQEMKSLNGYEYPAPETVAPKIGTRYYVATAPLSRLYIAHIWNGDVFDLRCLKAGLVHLSEENVIAHTMATIKAGGGEI